MTKTEFTSGRVLFLSLAIILLPLTLSASIFYSEDRYTVAAGDTINDDIYLAGSEGLFDGTVIGDIIIAAKDYTVTGNVVGNIISASQTANIRGNIEKSARMGAQTILLDGRIGNNLLAFGSDVEIYRDCRIGKDATIFGNSVSVAGVIERDLSVECNQIVISGKINGDVNLTAAKISIVSPAEILGDITYKSEKELNIGEDVIVGGQIEWNKVDKDEADKDEDDGLGFFPRFMFFLASLVTGLFLIGLTNRHSHLAADQIIKKPVVSLGVGFVAFCVLPVLIAVLIVLIISIPVAVMLLFAYTAFFYIAKIYVAIAVGRIGIRAFKKDTEIKQGWALFLGLIVLSILFVIPVLGWIVYFAVIFWGMGGILMGIRICRQRMDAPKVTPDSPSAAEG